MVLATRLIILGALSLGATASGCSAQVTGSESPGLQLGDAKVELAQSVDTCTLEITQDGKTLAFDTALKAPCHFAVNSSGKLLTYKYSEQQLDAVALIVGNPITSETRSEWGLDKELFCGEKLQAVFLKDGTISLSPSTSEGGVTCPSEGVDEKVFYQFAYPR